MISFNRIVWVACSLALAVGTTARAGGPTCGGWESGPLVGSTPNGANGIVRAVTNWDPDGAGPLPEHLVAGGQFTTMEGVVVNGIAVRSPLTGQWQALGSGVAGQVRSLAVYNGELIAGGIFATAGGISVNNIARWNGTQWNSMGSGIQLPIAGDSGVYALASYNGQLYAGGTFIAAGGITTFGIARWNGSAWSTVGSGLGASSEWVSTLTVHIGELVISGNFTSVGGLAANNIARWNGFFWQTLGSGTNGIVGTTCSLNGELYAGGTFNLAGGLNVTYTAKWNGSSWAALPALSFPVTVMAVYNNQVWMSTTTGQLSQIYFYTGTQWTNVNASGAAVYVMGTHGSDLIVGGNFTSVGSTFANFIVRRIGTVWYPFGGLSATSVKAFHQFGSNLLVGGGYLQQTSNGQPLTGLLAWNGTDALSTGLNSNAEVLDLHSFDLADGSGNHQLLAARATSPYVMRCTANPASDPTTWTWVAASGIGALALNNSVYGIERYNGSTYIGGEFTSTQVAGRNGIARMTGTNGWGAVGGGIDNDVYALKVYNGQLYAGGNFASVNDGALAAVRLVRWNGTAWSAVNNTVFNGAGTFISSLEVHEGRLIIGGQFPGPANSPNLAAYDGTTVTSIAPVGNGGATGAVRTIKSIGDRLYVGGDFMFIDGWSVEGMGYWDGNIWHEVGGGTGGGANAAVYALDLYGDQFHAGGVFSFVNDAGAVVRWAYEQPCPLCSGDIFPAGSPDGAVNVSDLLAVIGAWGACANPNDCPADIAPAGGNDVVNVEDLLAVIATWGSCP